VCSYVVTDYRNAASTSINMKLYAVLLILRIIATLQPGYIHPDELFQGGQEMFFACSSKQSATKQIHVHAYQTAVGNVQIDDITATWEFQSEHALRSVIPPTIMTILPLKVYSFFRQECINNAADASFLLLMLQYGTLQASAVIITQWGERSNLYRVELNS